MGTLSCTSEIVESLEESNLGKGKDEHIEKHPGFMVKPGQICSIEDDINRLFEAIDIRTCCRSLGRKNAKKRHMRPGSSQASGIGFSGSVTLKQSLRGLCISQASEMAAMKRLSRREGSSRAVGIEAGVSGLQSLNEDKSNVVEFSLVPVEIGVYSGKSNLTRVSLKNHPGF